MNILLADDSVPAQNMGKKILMDAGYGVVTVGNGLEALRKIAETVPDIAILDIFMPGYTGLEICKRLRSSAATADIPVILTVGKLEPYRPEDGEEVQSNAVIVKPFAAAELISAVRSLIGGPFAEAAARPGLQSGSQPASDPLQESPLAGGVIFQNPLVDAQTAADPTATLHLPALEEPDEPLFASAAGDASALTPHASSIYHAERPLFGSNAPASLAFDPDAKATPFSASAIEPLSPPAHSAAEGSAPAFTESPFAEFDLAPEPSPYSAYTAPAPEIPSHGFDAVPEMHAVPEHAAPEMLVADAGLHPEAAASPAAPESIDPAFDISAFDSLPELPGPSVPAAVSETGILEVPEVPEVKNEAPDQIPAEFAPLDAATAEDVPTSGAEQLSPEEEARRSAFEALFNSPEPLPLDTISEDTIPLDTVPASPAATAPVVLPDLAELSEDQMCRIELDSEVQEPESEALTDNQQHFSAPGVALNPLAPNPLDLDQVQPESVQPESVQPESVQPESQPLSAAASIPDLLEDPLTDLQSPDLQSEAVREAVREAVLPEAVPSQPRQPAPELLQSLLHSELEIPLANVAHLAAEAAPVHVEVPPVEVPPVPVEVPPAHLETPSEPVPPVLMPSYSVPVRAESAPMQVEPAPLDLPAPAEAEPLEPPQLQPEPQSTEISSPPGLSSRLNEAERIHHAVELVFDRFRPLLVAAIVRELARHN